MMISPDAYVDDLKNASYQELINKRDMLFQSIKEFEQKEIAGDRTGDEWKILPSPEVRYQMNLEYLSKLCAFMQEKYNTEFVWGESRLSDD